MSLPDSSILRSSLLSKKHIAKQEMKYLKHAVGKTIKTKVNHKRNEFGDLILEADKTDMMHEERELWARKHGTKLLKKFSTDDVRQLRSWFRALDIDRSGGIGMEELLDPLLSAGILRDKSDVRQLIELADTDGSGEIGFEEFLSALQKNQLCDIKNISRLQTITRPSDDGISCEMRLSEERRRHMMISVVEDTKKRQDAMDVLYGVHNVGRRQKRRASHKRSSVDRLSVHHMKMEKVEREQREQRKANYRYIESLEKVVDSHKRTIAKDNVISTTVRKIDPYGVHGGSICEDEELDIGYSGGTQGRSVALKRIGVVNKDAFGQGTYFMLPRSESSNDYVKYDSQATIYSTVEVTEGGKASVNRKKPRVRPLLQPLSTSRSEDNFDGSQRKEQVQVPDKSINSGPSVVSMLPPLSPINKKRSQLVRLNSKPLLASPLRRQHSHDGSPSVLKLKRMKSVEDFKPKNKISLIRYYHKNILIGDGDSDITREL